MPRVVSFALVFSIMLTLVGSVHYYIWARLVRDPGLPTLLYVLFTAVVVGLFVLVPVSFFLRRSGARWTLPLTWIASTWLGLMLLFLVSLAFADLVRAAYLLAGSLAGEPPLGSAGQLRVARIFAIGVALAVASRRPRCARASPGSPFATSRCDSPGCRSASTGRPSFS